MNGLLPAFSMAAIWLAGLFCRKVFRDECLGALFFFLAAALSCAGLVFVFDSKAILALLFSSLICGCMHAVNLMLVGYVPLRYKRFGQSRHGFRHCKRVRLCGKRRFFVRLCPDRRVVRLGRFGLRMAGSMSGGNSLRGCRPKTDAEIALNAIARSFRIP